MLSVEGWAGTMSLVTRYPNIPQYIVSTTLPFTAPALGTAVVQVLGSGSAATMAVTLSGKLYSMALNAGNALAANSLYEFGFSMVKGDVISAVSGATFIRVIFAY